MRRVAMISGASRGIGLAIARELKQAGLALSLGIRTPGSFSDPLATDARTPNDELKRLIRLARRAALQISSALRGVSHTSMFDGLSY